LAGPEKWRTPVGRKSFEENSLCRYSSALQMDHKGT